MELFIDQSTLEKKILDASLFVGVLSSIRLINRWSYLPCDRPPLTVVHSIIVPCRPFTGRLSAYCVSHRIVSLERIPPTSVSRSDRAEHFSISFPLRPANPPHAHPPRLQCSHSFGFVYDRSSTKAIRTSWFNFIRVDCLALVCATKCSFCQAYAFC